MIEFIRDVKDDTVDAIENIKNEPITSLGYIIPTFVSLVAVIGFMVAYIIFIANGGYLRQVDLLRELNFESILNTFSWGTIGVVLKGFLPIFEGVFIIIESIFIVIAFFMEESTFRRILLSINMIVIGFILAFFLFALWGDANSMANVMDKNIVDIVRKLVVPLFIAGLVLVVTFCLQLFFSECKERVIYMLVAIGISYLGSPLLLLALENIIPLIIVVIVAVIIGIIFMVGAIGGSVGSVGSSGGSYGSSSVGGTTKNIGNMPSTTKDTGGGKSMKKHELTGDVQLRVESDFFGTQIVNAYRKWNGQYTRPIHWGVVAEVTLYQFKTGEVEIYINNKRATERDLVYKKN